MTAEPYWYPILTRRGLPKPLRSDGLNQPDWDLRIETRRTFLFRGWPSQRHSNRSRRCTRRRCLRQRPEKLPEPKVAGPVNAVKFSSSAVPISTHILGRNVSVYNCTRGLSFRPCDHRRCENMHVHVRINHAHGRCIEAGTSQRPPCFGLPPWREGFSSVLGEPLKLSCRTQQSGKPGARRCCRLLVASRGRTRTSCGAPHGNSARSGVDSCRF